MRRTHRQLVANRPLPTSVPSYLGPIPILLVPDLKSKAGDDLYGEWDYVNRIIRIRENVTSAVRWQAFFHELVHVALQDAGLHMSLTDAMQEAICDTIGTFYVSAVQSVVN